MKIYTSTTEEISNEWNYIPVNQNIENLLSSQETSRSSAGWRRIRSETLPSTAVSIGEESQEQLQIQFEQAMEAEQYEKILGIIDQMKDIPYDLPYVPGCDSEISKLHIKSYCLKKLGRLEEAYFFATEALTKVSFLAEKAKEEFVASLRDYDISVYDSLLAYLNQTIDQQVAALQRELLMARGFLSLALNQKELAIDDFRKAAHCDCDDFDTCYDPEFLFRVLEKALGTQIAPFKDYEKEITTLLEKTDLSEKERYQLVMYYALLGQHDKALEWYGKIEILDDFPAEVPFFLAYLKGDMETARKEFGNEDYKFIIQN